MKNLGTAIGLSAIGLGIGVNGLDLSRNQATAFPMSSTVGPQMISITSAFDGDDTSVYGIDSRGSLYRLGTQRVVPEQKTESQGGLRDYTPAELARIEELRREYDKLDRELTKAITGWQLAAGRRGRGSETQKSSAEKQYRAFKDREKRVRDQIAANEQAMQRIEYERAGGDQAAEQARQEALENMPYYVWAWELMIPAE